MSNDEEFHLVIPISKLPMQYTNGLVSPVPDPTQGQRMSEGDLILNETSDAALNRFHENAIKQAGFGRYQILATIIISFGLFGYCMQFYTIPYIIPSAEVEFCIRDDQKKWLSAITFIGTAIGSLIFGGLAGRIGRRKTLLCSLAVSAIFSFIAALMPTYGPFMMARFCGAVGSGGILPSAICYIFEIIKVKIRLRLLGIVISLGLFGGLFAGGIAKLSIPWSGQQVVIESTEHFSEWHRYLLFASIPFFISIFGLFYLTESPRFLLDNDREVEALQVYQKIFQINKITKSNPSPLSELELPESQYHSVNTSVLTNIKISFGKVKLHYY